jgi:hypothetical protein
MTFYVRKRLALGPIRFGVSPRQRLEYIDDEPEFSTGANGEFIRYRGGKGFFFGDVTSADRPRLQTGPSITATPFWESLKPDGTPRSYGLLALMALGVILTLAGLSVVTRKGPQGWVEVIFGLAMVGTPIVMTAQQRKAIRDREARERAEWEASEKHNRDLFATYTTALERVRNERSDEAIQALARERGALMLPYDMWGGAARRTVLLIGFDELSKRGLEGAGKVSDIMSEVSRAAGITRDDEIETKADLYRTLLWHLLANDRLGTVQQQQLAQLRTAFKLEEEPEQKVIDEFDRLRGIGLKNLPQASLDRKLGFQESAIYQTTGMLMQLRDRYWTEVEPCKLLITNKRLIAVTKKETSFPLTQIDDIDVDVDTDVMTVKTAVSRRPIQVRVEGPIYSAGILELAASMDQRRSLV